MKFNLNDHVRVKLTSEGRRIHRHNHDKMIEWAINRGGKAWEYRAPEEDKDGWSKWQMWVLMKEFGPNIYNGCTVPFETEIEILEGD